MAIKFTKKETRDIIHDDDFILTPLYGKIKVIDNVNDNYTYFDTVGGYDLFINNDADNTVAVKSESIKKDNLIDNTIEKLKNKYPDLERIEYINSENGDNAIIIKASETNNKILDEIKDEYAISTNFNPNKITSNVLFLEIKDVDISLKEETDVLDLLSDQDMKNVISKTGVKLKGDENKERLKGMIQGILTTSK